MRDQLPPDLQQAVDELTHATGSLMRANQEISERYRNPNLSKTPLITSDAHRMAYLTTRLPATYQAVTAVLEELIRRAPTLAPKTLLDIGAGPGTASWAALNAFPSLEKVSLVERDAEFIKIGQQLANHSTTTVLKKAAWLAQDLAIPHTWPAHDLVVFSYSFGELEPQRAEEVLKSCWESSLQALVVVEPGTPRGYENVLRARQRLAEWGGRLIAPCPHAERCPMQGTPDWCHFACRVSRSSRHRHTKAGELGYEDEKYSYVAMTQDLGDPVEARIVRHPQVRSGHVQLELCTLTGLQKQVVSKKQGELYRWARKAKWGDGK